MHRYRTIPAVLGCDQAKSAASFILGKSLLLVTGLQSGCVRKNPDLQKVNRRALRCILLTVSDSSPGRHRLYVSWPNDGAIPHAVLMFERTFEDIRDDLHVAVTMRGEAV